MEGILETRGPGIMGKWGPQWFRLDTAAARLDGFAPAASGDPAAAAQGTALTSVLLGDVQDLELQAPQRELTLVTAASRVRLRAASAESIVEWFEAIRRMVPKKAPAVQEARDDPAAAALLAVQQQAKMFFARMSVKAEPDPVVVDISVLIKNLDLVSLAKNKQVLAVFEDTMRAAVASSVGLGVSAAAIALNITHAEGAVRCSVTPPSGVTAEQVIQAASRPGALCLTISVQLARIQGLRAFAEGPRITVHELSPPATRTVSALAAALAPPSHPPPQRPNAAPVATAQAGVPYQPLPRGAPIMQERPPPPSSPRSLGRATPRSPRTPGRATPRSPGRTPRRGAPGKSPHRPADALSQASTAMPVPGESPRSSVAGTTPRVHELHALHVQALERVEEYRSRLEEEDRRQLAAETEALRLGTRANLDPSSLNPLEAAERLHADMQRREERRRALVAKVNAEKASELRRSRVPKARRSGSSEPRASGEEIGRRLYTSAVELRTKKKKELDDSLAKELPMTPALHRGPDANRLAILHEEHLARMVKLEKARIEQEAREAVDSHLRCSCGSTIKDASAPVVMGAMRGPPKTSCWPPRDSVIAMPKIRCPDCLAKHFSAAALAEMNRPTPERWHQALERLEQMHHEGQARQQRAAQLKQEKTKREEEELQLFCSCGERRPNAATAGGGSPRGCPRCPKCGAKWPDLSASGRVGGADLTRLHGLHEEHADRLERRQLLVAARPGEEMQLILRRCACGKHEFKAGDEEDARCPRCHTKRPLESNWSEGSPQVAPMLSTIETTAARDHALAAVAFALARRCGPLEGPEHGKAMAEAAIELAKVMDEYRSACEHSDQNGEGAIHLRAQPSMRLFKDGRLMEDPVGQEHCCEPDPLRQLQEDLGDLMEAAQVAQAKLLIRVGPGAASSSAEIEAVARRWPPGSKWANPALSKGALFAYNPGPKSREAAHRKAYVRFGPAEGMRRFRHIMDFARVSLVYSDAGLLRVGLHDVLTQFEVLDVRNHYRLGLQGHLCERYVEVLVVVKEGLELPHICEIRLEEFCFFSAREAAASHLEAFCGHFRGMYANRSGLDLGALEYLASWTLRVPHQSHNMRRFLRHLARHWGSAVVTWRRALGNDSQVSFNCFRDACSILQLKHRSTELWQELDPGRGGCISLHDLDPDAVALLARLRAKVVALAPSGASVETLFARLTSTVDLRRPGQIENFEFRMAVKPFGFTAEECDRIFRYLDFQGGDRRHPPATLTLNDLGWLLKKFPLTAYLGAVTLASQSETSEADRLRSVMFSGTTRSEATRFRMPRARTKSLAAHAQRAARQTIAGATGTSRLRSSGSLGSAIASLRQSSLEAATSAAAAAAAASPPPRALADADAAFGSTAEAEPHAGDAGRHTASDQSRRRAGTPVRAQRSGTTISAASSTKGGAQHAARGRDPSGGPLDFAAFLGPRDTLFGAGFGRGLDLGGGDEEEGEEEEETEGRLLRPVDDEGDEEADVYERTGEDADELDESPSVGAFLDTTGASEAQTAAYHQAPPHQEEATSMPSASRSVRIGELFRLLDAHGRGALHEEDLEQLALMCHIEGTWEDWGEMYLALCEEAGWVPEAGVTQKQLADAINDQDNFFYSTDDEIEEMVRHLSAKQRPAAVVAPASAPLAAAVPTLPAQQLPRPRPPALSDEEEDDAEDNQADANAMMMVPAWSVLSKF